VLSLSVGKQTKQAQRRTREAHVCMLQEHAREGAKSRYVAGSSSILVPDRAIGWRRCELWHRFEVAVRCQSPLAVEAGGSITTRAACRDVTDAGVEAECR
jgi:hypothetical protein